MSRRRSPAKSVTLSRTGAVTGALTAALTLSLTFVLVGCGSNDDESSISVDSLVGRSVPQTESALPQDSSMVSYDLSKPVTGKESEPGLSDDTNRGDWIVVAACANTKNVEDDTRLAVGVLNTDAYSNTIARKAKNHAFDRYLSECE